MPRWHVTVEVETTASVVRVARPLRLGMMLNEAMTNAAKYAYGAPNAGRLELRVKPRMFLPPELALTMAGTQQSDNRHQPWYAHFAGRRHNN